MYLFRENEDNIHQKNRIFPKTTVQTLNFKKWLQIFLSAFMREENTKPYLKGRKINTNIYKYMKISVNADLIKTIRDMF